MPVERELIEQQIFLGGQVSHKYEVFKEIARMSPDWAIIYELLKKMPEWEKEPDNDKVVLAIVELFGEIEFIRSCTELTVLSMILGDTRGRTNAKGVMDELRTAGSNPQP
jgi:hypothetical protein